MNSKTKGGEPKRCSWYADTSALLSSDDLLFRVYSPDLSLVPGERRRDSATAIREGFCYPPICLCTPSGTRHLHPADSTWVLVPGLSVELGFVGNVIVILRIHTYLGPVWYPPSAPGALNLVSGSFAELDFVLVLRREDHMSRRLCVRFLREEGYVLSNSAGKRMEFSSCDCCIPGFGLPLVERIPVSVGDDSGKRLCEWERLQECVHCPKMARRGCVCGICENVNQASVCISCINHRWAPPSLQSNSFDFLTMSLGLWYFLKVISWNFQRFLVFSFRFLKPILVEILTSDAQD